MKTIVPDYYPLFRCKAGACRHTCCAGWEIDIDEKTLENYNGVGGSLGRKMKESISEGHFILQRDEMCPFLNREALCDIITELGEDMLCQVCSDHPRFRNYAADRTEIGLGLTCEAAAELILMRKEPVKLIVAADDGENTVLTDEEAEMIAMRDRMLCIAQDRSVSIDERLEMIADAAGIELPSVSLPEWIYIYKGLERLDEVWTERLSRPEKPVADDVSLEQLLEYLIFRHIMPACEDDDAEGRTAFVLSSFQFIRLLGGNLIETARMWSSEIEYSDENVGILTNACFK